MSKLLSTLDPNDLLPLLRHLRIYGEATAREITALKAEPWPPVLAAGGWARAPDEGIWFATPALLHLPAGMDDAHLLRTVCFAYPPYRRRLLAVLAQGLVEAGQRDLAERLEDWIVRDLPHLAADLNALLDELEAGDAPILAWPSAQVQALFEALHAELGDFAAWDQALLGFSNDPARLFMVVLQRFAQSTRPLSSPADPARPLALLPALPLRDDGMGGLVAPHPVPWTIRRRHVHSSLPLFDPAGRPCYDQQQPVQAIWQDALVRQPFYRVVIHLAYANRLGRGEAGQVSLRCTGDLDDTVIEVDRRPIDRLSDHLSALVAAIGYAAWLPASLAAERLANLLENLLAVHVLAWRDGELMMAETYALSLNVPPRARMLARGEGRAERERLLAYLGECVNGAATG